MERHLRLPQHPRNNILARVRFADHRVVPRLRLRAACRFRCGLSLLLRLRHRRDEHRGLMRSIALVVILDPHSHCGRCDVAKERMLSGVVCHNRAMYRLLPRLAALHCSNDRQRIIALPIAACYLDRLQDERSDAMQMTAVPMRKRASNLCRLCECFVSY